MKNIIAFQKASYRTFIQPKWFALNILAFLSGLFIQKVSEEELTEKGRKFLMVISIFNLIGCLSLSVFFNKAVRKEFKNS